MKITDKNGNRWYKQGNKEYPSVTWILNYYPKGEGFFKWLIKNGEESNKIRDSKRDIGLNVHKKIEETLIDKNTNTDNLTDQEKLIYKSFLDWYTDQEDIEIISVEEEVVNEQESYGGTIDIVAKINGILWVLDVKTTNYINTTHKLQLSAYKHTKYPNAKTGIIKLNEFGYEFKETEDLFELFKHVKAIWSHENGK